MELESDIIYIDNLASEIITPNNLITINILFNSNYISTIYIFGNNCKSEYSINLDIIITEQYLL